MDTTPTTLPSLSRPVTDVIRARSSWRAYESRSIAPELRAHLDTFGQTDHRGIFGNPVRIALCDMDPPDFLELRQSGTYGMIKGARLYLIGAVGRAANNMVDFGFCFEQAILLCTDLGLQTCWVGGTLNRSIFGQRMGTQPSEIVPAISPVGHGTRRRALRDLLVRFGARSHKRRPWSEIFFQSTFGQPLTQTLAEAYAPALEAVRLAPSASNQQPWCVVRSHHGDFHFFLQRTAMYRSKLLRIPEIDLQRIDLGIALCHFHHTAAEAGLKGGWEYLPQTLRLPPHTQYIVSWTGA